MILSSPVLRRSIARRLPLLLLVTLLAARPAAAQSRAATAAEPAARYRRASLGVDAGWGAPAGWGLTYSHMIGQQVDWTLGAGFNLSGAKVGLGARYYVAPTRRLSPWFGAALVLSSGLNNVEVSSGNAGDHDFGGYSSSRDPLRTYSIDGGLVGHLRSGVRWQLGRVGFLGALGYGLPLGADPLQLPAGMVAADRRVARLLGPGGVEVSLGVLIGLGN